MVPSSARLRPTRLFCAQRLLSLVYSGPRLPAPSLGRDHAGQSSSSHRWCGAVESRWRSVAGKGPVHTPACAVPPPTEGRCGMGSGRVAVGIRPHTRLRFVPVPSVACVRPARVHVLVPLPRCGRAAHGACCVLSDCAVVASPPSLGGDPTAGGIAGVSLPSLGLRRARVLRG